MFIKDADCTINTPVKLGKRSEAVYGMGHIHYPAVPGKQDTKYDQDHYLPALLPLEAYDLIVLLYSGGKDSLAAYEVLREKGVPKEKIELWHHDIDGQHPTRRMDWPVTQAYVAAFAKAEGVTIRKSWRLNGFWGEVYRKGASWPVQYEDNDGSTTTCHLSQAQIRSDELRQIGTENADEELRTYGYRYKFPAKTTSLITRWCSASLKVDVAASVIRNLNQLRSDVKVLIVSGERRGESAGRAKYNEMEIHRTNATKKANRLVHVWRPVIDYHEGDVWEVIKRNHVRPHPCYAAGWNRCSCMMCIFSQPKHWAGIRQLFPEDYAAVREDEKRLGFTLDNKADLDTFVGDAESCLYPDQEAIDQLQTGRFTEDQVYVTDWQYPAGAFKGSAGGPC